MSIENFENRLSCRGTETEKATGFFLRGVAQLLKIVRVLVTHFFNFIEQMAQMLTQCGKGICQTALLNELKNRFVLFQIFLLDISMAHAR